jgi:NurA-like 5'-3' nuclease
MGHLRRGERSARFASRSPVLRYYGDNAGIQFVYLDVGGEIARVEVPAWVGDDPATLDLVHAVVYDGCARGWGYPPALSEAHEQAVIRGGEREAFLRMVMEALNVEGQPAMVSAKGLSKNRRAV